MMGRFSDVVHGQVPLARQALRRDPSSWHETLFSERGTLIAIALGYLLLWIKHDVWR